MYFDKKEKLQSIFKDTMAQIKTEPKIKKAAHFSIQNTKFYGENELPTISAVQNQTGMVMVTANKTFEAAKHIHKQYPEKKVAVLNFASAVNPGGGVAKGSSAQEESLCRCSTLYCTLNQEELWQKYYNVNRAMKNPIHTDACIYSPSVLVFKSDGAFPETLPESEWFYVDVISCAAPNLRKRVGNIYNTESGEVVRLSADELYRVHLERARHIFTVAIDNGVDCLVLGAFGCGAFENDPTVVARAYADATAEFRKYFDCIEYAVYCRAFETSNYNAFKYALHPER